jgi:ribose transport system permease protein
VDVSHRVREPGPPTLTDQGIEVGAPAPAVTPPLRRPRFSSNLLLIILVVDVVFVLVSQFGLETNLLGRSSLSTVTPVLGVLVLMSLAQGIVIGTGGIDLSIPATITLTGTITLKASGGTDGGLGKAIATILVVCVVIGVVNGTLVEVFRLNPLVVTLATGQLIGGITRLYRGPVPSVSQVPPALASFTSKSYGGVNVILLLAVACVVILYAVLNLTVPGRRLVASSASGRAAKLAGLAAVRYRIAAWALATVVCGLGALLLAGQVGSPDLTLGDPYLLSTVVAVVLGGAVLSGGRVSPAGVALGAVFIAVLNQDLQVRGYSTGVANVAQGIVLGLGLALLGLVRGGRMRRVFSLRR